MIASKKDNMKLEKEIISVQSEFVTVGPTDLKIEDFKERLTKLEKKAKETGITDLKVQMSYDQGDVDCDNRPLYTMCLIGKRLETEGEWHKRLEDQKVRSKRELETAKAIVARSAIYDEKIKNIDAALDTSTLRCEKCNSPCSYTTYMSNWSESKRVCYDCCNKIRVKSI
jgi:hypothetical protein